MKFDVELYMVKGIWVQDEENPIITGFYRKDKHGRHFICPKDCECILGYETNPYTLCRNIGIKTKDGEYLYENDVVQYTPVMSSNIEYGYVDFDEYYQGYCIRTGIEHRGTRAFRDCSDIKRTGKNIVLCDDDYEWFQKYEAAEYEKSKGNVIDNSYCPSKFRR